MYASRPGKPAENNEAQTQSKRTNVGSTSKYSARPPQTPQSFLSVIERYNFFFSILPLFFVPPSRNEVYGRKNTRFFLIPKGGKRVFFIGKVCNPFFQPVEYQPL